MRRLVPADVRRLAAVALPYLSEGAGGTCLALAGWFVFPPLGLAMAGGILIIWSGRSDKSKGDH